MGGTLALLALYMVIHTIGRKCVYDIFFSTTTRVILETSDYEYESRSTSVIGSLFIGRYHVK